MTAESSTLRDCLLSVRFNLYSSIVNLRHLLNYYTFCQKLQIAIYIKLTIFIR
jgi:hypothetical protein